MRQLLPDTKGEYITIRVLRPAFYILCLVEDENKILLQNRIKKDWQGYALPGGHVELGESFVDAVIREIKEETGLVVIEPRLAGVKQFPMAELKNIMDQEVIILVL